MKCLIVEDDREYQKKFMEVLRLQNIPCDFAIGALTASDLIDNNNYFFIILDLRLAEGTTGADLLDYMGKKKKFIPVLIISEHIKAYQHLLMKFFSNENFIINEIDKNLPEIKLANHIKTFIDILECRELRLIKFPEIVNELENQKSKVSELSDKITVLQEQDINNFDFSNEMKVWLKMGFAKYGGKIIAGVFALLGMGYSLVSGMDIEKSIQVLFKVIESILNT